MEKNDIFAIEKIVHAVISGYVQKTVTNQVPDTKDILSAHIILNHGIPMECFGKKHPNTLQWIESLKNSHKNWQNILQDFLFLVKESD